jgi:hypothetical protein
VVLGLVPWELMTLDQTLTVIHSSPVASNSLETHSAQLSTWFMYYAVMVNINLSPSKDGSPLQNHQRSSQEENMSFAYNGTDMYTSYHSNGNYSSAASFQSSANSSFRNRSPSRMMASTSSIVKAISYKTFSKFAHNFGIVPFIMKESVLCK